MKKQGYVRLFANCLLTKGATRALLFDAQRKQYFPVPLSMADMLEACALNRYEVFLQDFLQEDKDILEEYMDFLTTEHLVSFFDTREDMSHFPDMSLQWHFPAEISNAVVVVDNISAIASFQEFKKDHFIHTVQYILSNAVSSIEDLDRYIDKMIAGKFSGVQVLFNNGNGFSDEVLLSLMKKYAQIELMVAFSSGQDKVVEGVFSKLVMSSQENYTVSMCGVVAFKYMSLELNHFTESQHHNTCLNRKLSVDVEGNIKNCLSMRETFGNIADVTLSSVLHNPAFSKYWHITKDEILVCKDCEFRHVCTDCRAYLESPEDIYSKPLKCGYNPYTGEWEAWSTHPMKQQAIEYYGLKGIIKEVDQQSR